MTLQHRERPRCCSLTAPLPHPGANAIDSGLPGDAAPLREAAVDPPQWPWLVASIVRTQLGNRANPSGDLRFDLLRRKTQPPSHVPPQQLARAFIDSHGACVAVEALHSTSTGDPESAVDLDGAIGNAR